MNMWAAYLAACPATVQRLIARANRVSLPRPACPPAERLRRLRLALMHQRTVREMYFLQSAEVQSAMQDLRTWRGGIAPADLTAHYGTIRSWRQMAASIAPQSISERLLLLGWLLPRPAQSHRAACYLVPPEVRVWLPQPLRLAPAGAAPAPGGVSWAVRATVAILVAASEHPLPVQQNGRLRQSTRRLLAPRLTPTAGCGPCFPRTPELSGRCCVVAC